MFRNLAVSLVIFGSFCCVPAFAKGHDHEFEKTWSTSKPSSESHRWSYKKACDNCLEAIEKRHGVDWKITDVKFHDKGRSTKTDGAGLGKGEWRCSHTVTATYNIVRRGSEDDSNK